MHDHGNPSGRFSLSRYPAAAHWGLLLVLSLALAGIFDAIHLPAAVLLGAMLASISVAIADGSPRIPRKTFVIAQSIVGCLAARSITADIYVWIREDWLLFLSATVIVILACAGMGWILAKKQVLPGTTAVWATSPGGASVMTLMSDSYGGDMRLVGVMQYMRVALVSVLAMCIARLWADVPTAPTGVVHTAAWFANINWMALGETLLLASTGPLFAKYLRLPSAPLLLPLFLGSYLQIQGIMEIVLPPWILIPAYIVIGWSVGLRFTRQTLSQIGHALPSMILSIGWLIAVCGAVAVALTYLTHIDPLTAYLATSPGGFDSVVIIAASSNVNVPFVMAFQTARLLIVFVTGPMLARFIARRLLSQQKH